MKKRITFLSHLLTLSIMILFSSKPMISHAETKFWISSNDKVDVLSGEKDKYASLDTNSRTILIMQNPNNGEIWSVEKARVGKNNLQVSYVLHHYSKKGKHKNRFPLKELNKYKNSDPYMMAWDSKNELIYISINHDVLKYDDTGEYARTYSFPNKPLFISFDNSENYVYSEEGRMYKYIDIIIPLITALMVVLSAIYVPTKTHKLLTKTNELAYKRKIIEERKACITNQFEEWERLLETIEHPNTDDERTGLRNSIKNKKNGFTESIGCRASKLAAEQSFDKINKLLKNRNLRDNEEEMNKLRALLIETKILCVENLHAKEVS